MTGSVQTLTLGMGCFWSPDALFGHLPGVIRTRTGYAGGTTSDPVYRAMGDHSETVEIDFDPDLMALEDILEVFWQHHRPENINDYKGRQYRSLLLYRDDTQHAAIRDAVHRRVSEGRGEPATEIAPFRAFYPAEERHQKYYLKRYPHAVEQLGRLYPTPAEFTDATLTARLNGLAKGYANLAQILAEIGTWPLGQEERVRLQGLVRQIRW
ncbi:MULTISPECIES: peptide-methionine (S)-S-oxide reductase MsrA [Paenibacillus]|uniref:peptide-methionine (S)-S-oxide reductase MsrA n=1 Tax=Paenibacillus TaxID=44249 RepID=UPI0022B86ABD|nr:peptide-methionine (S)-S-oxide reductase [Paenibacillus caseinilyticus]MCZ8520373.1 peptide-methionine (S)-S-oxide reductase [Paenibacillus caseinilyticus]